MKQRIAVNPVLPKWEYVPDGEPRIFGNRLYLFGSHDKFNSDQFCQNDYVCWSAPLADLSDWTYHGVMYRRLQDPAGDEVHFLQAPDVVQGADGRFYLYYSLALIPFVSVAVADQPEGPYEYYGQVIRQDGTVIGTGEHDVFMFDPGVLIDDDGEVYLYTGFGPEEKGALGKFCEKYQMNGAYVCRLLPDMRTAMTEPQLFVPKKGKEALALDFETKGAFGQDFNSHEFFEASSMRKLQDTYYFIYSSTRSHELCYAFSKYPDRQFAYGGTLVSNGDIGIEGNTVPRNYIGNTHGGIVCVEDQWYVFYHRHTNRHQYSRQACAEKLIRLDNGHFLQAELTSCGLSKENLSGDCWYDAGIACHLMVDGKALEYGLKETPEAEKHPYFTQSDSDCDGKGDQYIANMRHGAMAGYKYLNFQGESRLCLKIRGNSFGKIQLSFGIEESVVSEISIDTTEKEKWTIMESELAAPIYGTHAVYIRYVGIGCIDFAGFQFQKER